ncbi:hypothetical protein CLAFUW4_10598 [Fulvia fulva]|uniref:Uncharacterized protein n=1 Tax=Passalora fulva TaxID=5499 RepID=A0A9Q8LGT1_PASFU|nr:uncharacterized protein CLAFUR5_05211 [Fulvia fulva]KAK4616109.1 hypothetical protein CLAFUR4_10603 [Fulvia fulva]KAK4616639.1 hypothetical protein CLAFUR0_10641 [Fulvia fulva]UJO17164.1 hypothetical protein CLAFUR5_05211 [Fulvia fulva]WPV18823.1 hypothetical protein CLAFUW4_10598 [Fulvia fulva]WPV34042.1 hypothetical protein CLAFUW7_10600 [Fulvia fulva]
MKTISQTHAAESGAASATSESISRPAATRPKRTTKASQQSSSDHSGQSTALDPEGHRAWNYERATKTSTAKAKALVSTKAATNGKLGLSKTNNRAAGTKSSTDKKSVASEPIGPKDTARSTRFAKRQARMGSGMESARLENTSETPTDEPNVDVDGLSRDVAGPSDRDAEDDTQSNNGTRSRLGGKGRKRRLDVENDDTVTQQAQKRQRNTVTAGEGDRSIPGAAVTKQTASKQIAGKQKLASSRDTNEGIRTRPSRSSNTTDAAKKVMNTKLAESLTSKGPGRAVEGEATTVGSAGQGRGSYGTAQAAADSGNTNDASSEAADRTDSPGGRVATSSVKQASSKRKTGDRKRPASWVKAAEPEHNGQKLSRSMETLVDSSSQAVYRHAEELGYGKMNMKKPVVTQIQKAYAENIDQDARNTFVDRSIEQHGREFWTSERYLRDLPIFAMDDFLYVRDEACPFVLKVAAEEPQIEQQMDSKHGWHEIARLVGFRDEKTHFAAPKLKDAYINLIMTLRADPVPLSEAQKRQQLITATTDPRLDVGTAPESSIPEVMSVVTHESTSAQSEARVVKSPSIVAPGAIPALAKESSPAQLEASAEARNMLVPSTNSRRGTTPEDPKQRSGLTEGASRMHLSS